jgi:hypothetical protein
MPLRGRTGELETNSRLRPSFDQDGLMLKESPPTTRWAPCPFASTTQIAERTEFRPKGVA